MLLSSWEKRLSIPSVTPSMFAQSQRPHQWSRCCGCNCRTPHRRIVINAFYATKTPRTVSSSASNSSGCAAAIFSNPWLKGSFVRDSLRDSSYGCIIQQGIFIRTDINNASGIAHVNAASPPPVVTSVRLSPAAGWHRCPSRIF